MTKIKKAITRETSVIEERKNKPLVIKLEEGGKLVKIKIKGERQWYTVTMMQILIMGARNMVAI